MNRKPATRPRVPGLPPGFSLMEMLIASAVMVTIGLGFVTMMSNTAKQRLHQENMQALQELRSRLAAEIQDPDILFKAVYAADNPELFCMLTAETCGATKFNQTHQTPTSGNLILRDSFDQTLVDHTQPNAGWDWNGKRCFNFNARDGHPNCVYKWSMTWHVICPQFTQHCGQPRMILNANLRFSPNQDFHGVRPNLQKYSIQHKFLELPQPMFTDGNRWTRAIAAYEFKKETLQRKLEEAHNRSLRAPWLHALEVGIKQWQQQIDTTNARTNPAHRGNQQNNTRASHARTDYYRARQDRIRAQEARARKAAESWRASAEQVAKVRLERARSIARTRQQREIAQSRRQGIEPKPSACTVQDEDKRKFPFKVASKEECAEHARNCTRVLCQKGAESATCTYEYLQYPEVPQDKFCGEATQATCGVMVVKPVDCPKK